MSVFLLLCMFFLQETNRLVTEPVPGITALPDEHNARYFHVTIAGPNDVSISFVLLR